VEKAKEIKVKEASRATTVRAMATPTVVSPVVRKETRVASEDKVEGLVEALTAAKVTSISSSQSFTDIAEDVANGDISFVSVLTRKVASPQATA